jgi:hypothetical protein
MGTAYVIAYGTAYDLGKATEGEIYKNLFEGLMAKFPDLAIDNDLLGRSYSMAAVYYFRKGITSRAKSIIDKGLTYAPNNRELLTRKRMIK